MKKNIGKVERAWRTLGAVVLAAGSVVAPLPRAASLALGLAAGYMLLTVLSGTCLGYALMGRSTCRARTLQ
jgi:hypothetical protein